MTQWFQCGKTEERVALKINKDDVNLEQWIFSMKNSDYQNCAKGHVAMGITTSDNGNRQLINVERFGKMVMVQHYNEDIVSKNHIRFISDQSDIFSGKLHMGMRVIWEMKIEKSENGMLFVNSVETASDNKIFTKIARFMGHQKMLDTHNREETHLFAKSIERIFN